MSFVGEGYNLLLLSLHLIVLIFSLKEFPLTPEYVLNKFEWEGSSILVMSAIKGRQVDRVFKKLYAGTENLFAWRKCRTSFGRTSSCASANAHIQYEVLARSEISFINRLGIVEATIRICQ